MRMAHPMHQCARLIRPKRLREITREHCQSRRRSTGASACPQWHCRQRARRCSAALFGARCAACQGRNGRTGGRRGGISRPGRKTCGAGQRDALQRIRRKDAMRGVVLLSRPEVIARRVAGSTACAAGQGARCDDHKRWQDCMVASSPSASNTMRQLAFIGHHTL